MTKGVGSYAGLRHSRMHFQTPAPLALAAAFDRGRMTLRRGLC